MTQLYVHTKRNEWGLAILAWEGPNKRRYQFQDGQLRTFGKGFWDLLEPVERPEAATERICAQLAADLRTARARREVEREARGSGRAVVALADQIAAFVDTWPGGFSDPGYLEAVRDDPEQPRKRHRDPAIAAAQAALGPEPLQALLAAGDHAGVRDRAIEVLGHTDLVSPAKHVQVLSELAGDELEAFASALDQLVCDAEDDGHRWTAWYALLAGRGSWGLLTALPALLRPDRELVVRPAVVRAQARWAAPSLKLPSQPSGLHYQRVLAMAQQLRRHLERAGLAPRDLFDVYELMWATLRPKAMERYRAGGAS